MKKRILWMLAAIFTICGAASLTSCSDNIDNAVQGQVVIPDGTDFMKLESYSYELPFDIMSDSEWKIEFEFDDGQICYAMPDHGTGSQTIQLCVIDNPRNGKRTGKMYIDFPKDESKNLVIDLQQLSRDNNMLGAVDLPLGNRAYVVGYGYNTLGERASMNSVSTSPIIAIAKADSDNCLVLGPMDASFVAKTYSGSSVSELSNELSADVSLKGKYLGFKAEVGASFGMSDFSKQENEYAINYVEADMQSVNLEMSISQIINKYMTDDAYNDINGLQTIGRSGQPRDTDYPSTEDGLAKLVQTYGTHLVMSARLGGCMKYIMTVDISQVEGSYDLKAFANCSYKNLFVKASMDVSDEYKQSYANNSKAIQTVIKVQGGSSDAAVALAAADGDNDANFGAWVESLKDVKNQTLVGLDNTTLIPLYELVDKSCDGGEDRYKKLKAYINGDKIEEDMSKALNMDYEMGDATHLASIPDFSDESNDQGQSLIKDYYRGGQAVARICNEYIPVIDKTKRVNVIYPIVSNKVKYNMGYFAGDATHRPAKVCWSADGLSVVSLVNEPMGAIKELYVRGSSFFDSSNDSIVHALETVDATIQPYTISASGRAGAMYAYPLVKIFNQIWMRQNYKASNNQIVACFKSADGDCYYTHDQVRAGNFAPQGWRVSSAVDFKSIQKTLNANDVTQISTAKAFFPDADGGVLGFYHLNNGYFDDGAYSDGKPTIHEDGTDGFSVGIYGCLESDPNNDVLFKIDLNEGFDLYSWWDYSTNSNSNSWIGGYYYTVRLVQDIY